MKKYGLIGKDISYSLSPFIHNFLISKYNLDAKYELIDVDNLKEVDFSKYSGLNVTTPYKEEILNFFNDKSNLKIVNTLKDKDAFNTDIRAFDKFFKRNIKKTKAVAILGNSATCKMLKKYFESNDVEVYIFSRTKGISYDDILKYDFDFLINTTPLGQGKYEGVSPIKEEVLNKLKINFVLDFNYNPINTKLLIDSKKNKIKSFSGLEILVLQAIYSFQIFTGIKVEEKYVEELILMCSIKLSRNTILYGMPLSGKSRIYKNLKEKDNIFDLDLEIEKKNNIKIFDFIKEYGVEEFRSLENESIKEYLKKPNSIIIVGGGFFTNLNNLNLIKDINVIYYKLSLKKLIYNYDNSKKIRPLIKSKQDLEHLYNLRKDLYESIYNLSYSKSKKISDILKLIKNK